MEYIRCHDIHGDRLPYPVLFLYSWKILRNTGNFLLYSSLYLAAAAVGMAYVSCFIQGFAPTIPVVAVLGMVVFSVYNLNRKTDETEDALNHAERFAFTQRYERYLFYAAVAAYGIALVIALVHSIPAFLVAWVPILSGVVYSVPLLPKTWGYRRLKEIPLGKNLVVSFAWATSFSLIPVYMTGIAPGYPALTIFFFLFAWTFIASVLPDIRDRTGDAATGVITIPVLLGVRKTRILLTLVNAFALAVVLALRVGSLNQVASIVMLGSMAYSQACILGIDHQYDNILCDMISDGQFLVIGMSCAIFSILVPALW